MQLELGKKQQLLLTGGVFLLAFISLYLLLESRAVKENVVLNKLLNSEYAGVFIAGEKTDIINGLPQKRQLDILGQNQALRMGWYQAKHRINPLFALPGTDLNALKKNTLKLEEIIRETSIYAKNFQEKEVMKYFHPFNFLHKLLELEQQRREILSYPDKARIERYHFTLLDTINAYKEGIKHYHRILSLIPGDLPLIFFYQESNRAQLEKALEKLAEESEIVLNEEKRRFKCYRGLIDSCSEILHPLLEEAGAPVKNRALFSNDVLLFLKRWYDPTFIKEPFDNTESSPETAKTIVTGAARCFPKTPSSFLYIELKDTEHNLTASKTETLSEIFFYRIKPESLESLEKDRAYKKYLASLVASGHTLQYQPFNLYTCPESGYDESRVLSIVEMYSLVNKRPLGKEVGGDEGEKLNLLEKTFIGNDHLSNQVVENYIAYLSKLVAEKDFRIKLIGAGKKNILWEAGERIVLWQSQTAGYEKTVAYAFILNRSMLFYIRDYDILPSSIFIIRSYPSVFFLPFNQTISKQAVFFSQQTTPAWGKKQRFREILPFTLGFFDKKTIKDLLESARSEAIFIQKTRDVSRAKNFYTPIKILPWSKEKPKI